MTEFLQEFGLPLKVIVWGYLIWQVVGVILFLVIVLPVFIRVWREPRD